MPARPPRTVDKPSKIIHFMLCHYPKSDLSRQRIARVAFVHRIYSAPHGCLAPRDLAPAHRHSDDSV